MHKLIIYTVANSPDLNFNPQFKQAGSVCRKSAGDCDLPEYCTGAAEECPEDSFEMNGKPCYNQAQGYCHDGQCPTYEQHCWRLFGPGTLDTLHSEQLFKKNKTNGVTVHTSAFPLCKTYKLSLESSSFLSIFSRFLKLQYHMVENDAL